MIKNTSLGGTDFSTPSDRVKPTDLNDTFNAAANLSYASLKSGLVAQANVQKTNFISEGIEFNYQNLDNLSDGNVYLVDGFGIPSTMDYTNSTIVADNEDTPNFSALKTKYVSHRGFSCKVLDNFNDSSVDSGIWTSSVTSGGAVSEGTESLRLASGSTNGATAAVISDGVSGLDLKSLSADSEFVLHVNSVHTTSTGNGFRLQISNGTTHIDIHTITASATDGQNTVKVKIDKSLENAHVSVNGGAFGGAIDISSVTTNWYIRMIAQNANTISTTSNIYFLGYVDGDGSTVDYVSASKTFSSTKTDGVLTWDFSGEDSDVAGFISSNDGTNYSATEKDNWTAIGTPGEIAKMKLTITTPSTIDATSSTSDIGDIKMVGAYFEG